MPPDLATPAHNEIRNVIFSINLAWQHQRGKALTDALSPYFAEQVIMRGPSFIFLGQGSTFAVETFNDFVSQAEVQDFTMEPPQIDIMGMTATAQYKWKMTYGLSRQEYTEQGHDLYILSRQSDRWLVIWRAMLPEPLPKPSHSAA